IYTKTDQSWWVRKVGKENKTLYDFSSDLILTNRALEKEVGQMLFLEDMDNSQDGTSLLLVMGYYKKEMSFIKNVYYQLDIKSGTLEKLFTFKNEKYNFMIMDNSGLVYMARTLEDEDTETMVVSLYNLKGSLVRNYLVRFDRKEAQWLNFNIQKDRIFAGLCIQDNKLNLMRWR
ncbi:MAG: hypothetical protein PHF84_03315, partial [bacterium]|nr:hypothetical protein [bacterium]